MESPDSPKLSLASPFPCKSCVRQFMTADLLEAHVGSCHSGPTMDSTTRRKPPTPKESLFQLRQRFRLYLDLVEAEKEEIQLLEEMSVKFREFAEYFRIRFRSAEDATRTKRLYQAMVLEDQDDANIVLYKSVMRRRFEDFLSDAWNRLNAVLDDNLDED